MYYRKRASDKLEHWCVLMHYTEEYRCVKECRNKQTLHCITNLYTLDPNICPSNNSHLLNRLSITEHLLSYILALFLYVSFLIQFIL